MSEQVKIRPLQDTDIGAITAIAEKIGGGYEPEVWENRLNYYMRRDPEASVVAEDGGEVVGFMMGELRSGEFGLEEPTGWIEVMGVDPVRRGEAIGRRLAESMLAYFKKRGATRVRTLVGEEMAGIASFFLALGFEPAGIQPLVKRL